LKKLNDTRFYCLGTTFGRKWFWGQVDLDPDNEFYVKGMVGFRGVVKVEIDAGTTAGDFLWNSHNLVIVSQRILDIWKQFGKFETYGVKVSGKASTTSYTGVVILGRGGPLDIKRSEAEIKYDLRPNGKPSIMGVHGLYFHEDKWDRSDLFTIDEFPLGCIVTERVAKAMKKARITNCKYTPVEEVKF